MSELPPAPVRPRPEQSSPPPAPEQPTRRNPETIGPTDALAAVKGRFLALQQRGRDVLNPNKRDLSPVQSSEVSPFDQRDYSPFMDRSKQERRAEWQGREDNDFNRQKATWVRDTTTTFTNAQRYLTESARGREWVQVFQTLGINAVQFDEQQAEQLYEQFLRPPDGMKQLVGSILRSDRYRNAQGGLDFAKVQQDQDAVKWISHIYGKRSHEIVSILTEMEAEYTAHPDQVLAKINGNERINNPNDHEVEILTFMSEGQEEARPAAPTPTAPQPQAPPQNPQPDNAYKWHYRRADDEPPINRYPSERVLQYTLNPNNVAARLKLFHPARYATISQVDLARQIEQEQRSFQDARQALNLNDERMVEIFEKHVGPFEQFLRTTYNVEIPKIERLSILPISGKVVESYNAGPHALAFVRAGVPAIFINMDAVKQNAFRLALSENGRRPTQEQIVSNVERLLGEIKMHENAHLIGDLAYWSYQPSREQDTASKLTIPAKVGTDTTKILSTTTNEENDVLELKTHTRGRGLMEAITVEMTDKWAAAEGKALDVDAYRDERNVLDLLVRQVAQEQGISQDEAFKLFARGYFSPQDFRVLAKTLSNPVHTADNKVAYTKPSYLSCVEAIMDYEVSRGTGGFGSGAPYPITERFISGTLTAADKIALQRLVDNLNSNIEQPVYLSPKGRQDLQAYINGSYPRSAEAA